MGSKTTSHTKIYPGGQAVTTETTATTGSRAVKAATGGRAGKAPAKKKATWTLRLGIWTYNSGTGQHVFKVGKILRVKSKTRTQRAAKRNAKAAATRAERARLATYFAEQTATPTTAPATSAPAPARKAAQRRTSSASPAPGHEPQQQSSADRSQSAAFGQHQQAMRSAGACGARTSDGTGCARRGHCPYHSRG